MLTFFASVASLVTGSFVGFLARKKIAEATIGSAEKEADSILINAKKLAEAKKKEILLEAKEESLIIKNNIELEANALKIQNQQFEARISQQEEFGHSHCLLATLAETGTNTTPLHTKVTFCVLLLR